MFDITKVDNVYKDYRIQLTEFKKVNEQTVFEYETTKGNKSARSHIYKLRKSKSAITKAHKEAKAEALEFGQKLDAEKKKLLIEIDDMIAVHDKPLKDIEEREKERIAGIQEKIIAIRDLGIDSCLGSCELQSLYDNLFASVIDDFFAEFKTQALETKDATLKRLVERIQIVKKQEAEQEELDRLRQEELARKQKEHDERIAREATERAEQQAKAKAEQLERDKLAAEQRAVNAERQRVETEERAKVETHQAGERARLDEIARQNAEQARIKAEQDAREANELHVNNIHKQAEQSFREFGLNEEQAKFNVYLVSAGKIKNIAINY